MWRRLTALRTLLINGLSPGKERDLVLVRPDHEANDDEDDEEHDQDDRDGHVSLHAGDCRPRDGNRIEPNIRIKVIRIGRPLPRT
ncbi:hypothetical protein BDW75DRAFT_222595 [Aspergillus navahoensis]